MDLQVEYWPMLGGKKDKSSLKTAFRSLTVQRLPSHADPSTTGLSMVVVTKEKNKKSRSLIIKKILEIFLNSNNFRSMN